MRLLLLPVEQLLVGAEQLPRFAVGQELDAMGLDVLLHVVPLNKPPAKYPQINGALFKQPTGMFAEFGPRFAHLDQKRARTP